MRARGTAASSQRHRHEAEADVLVEVGTFCMPSSLASEWHTATQTATTMVMKTEWLRPAPSLG